MSGIVGNGFMGSKSGGECLDADAQAFITAADITESTQQSAICQLVKDLKGVGSTINNTVVWSDLIYFWPIVGGTNVQHSIDLKGSLNMVLGDAAYSSSAEGIVSLGNSNGTYNVASPHIGNQNNACVFANNTSNSGNGFIWGVRTTVSNRVWLRPSDAYALYTTTAPVSIPDLSGVHAVQTGVGVLKGYRNGVEILSVARTINTASNNIGFLWQPPSVGTFWLDPPVNCAGMSFALSVNQHQDLSQSIQKFNTAIGRT